MSEFYLTLTFIIVLVIIPMIIISVLPSSIQTKIRQLEKECEKMKKIIEE